MEKTEVTIDNLIVLDGFTIIPIVSLSLNCWHVDHFTTVCGVKKPMAFLVISSAERRAYGICGEEVSIDQLIEEVPGLKDDAAKLISES